MKNAIITSFDYPPIPVRYHDWSAIREGYDMGDPVGRGETELEAITDLIEQEKELALENELLNDLEND